MPERLVLRRHPDAARLVARRAALLRALRACLDGQGLLEVDPSPLAPVAGPEPYLEPPAVDWPGLPGRLWLQTSPELAAKRLLCAGVPALYALGPVFRGGREELSDHHQPCFSMLEWYRPGDALGELMRDCLRLGEAAAAALGVPAPAAQRSLSVQEALAELAGLDAAPLFDGDVRDFAAAARAAGLSGCRDDHDATALLGRVLVERVEPALARLPGWTFLHGWPASQAALARLDDADPTVALRMEAYLGGFEIANGYVELLDAAALSRRWDGLVACRDGPGPPRDDALLAELAATPPAPTVGMALGVDRLFAALVGASRLAEVLPLHLVLEHGD